MMTAIQPALVVRIQAGLNRTKLREKTLGFYFISSSHDFRMRPSVPVTSTNSGLVTWYRIIPFGKRRDIIKFSQFKNQS